MTETADFLVELGTEELPPKALAILERAFAEGVAARLAATGLVGGRLRSFATPRRLAIHVAALPLRLAPQEIEKRGPPTRIAFDADGNPTRAALAFAEGLNVAVADLQRIATDRGEWLVWRGREPGRDAVDLLPEIVAAALAELPVPKRMRWGSSDVEFVRPAHWLVMLLGDTVVPAHILGIDAGNTTRGHRFHAPAPIKLPSPGAYEPCLADQGHVIADFSRRRARVTELAESAATAIGGHAVIEPAVLDEVTALVEWPVPVSGRFDARFLALPEEVLIATLQEHQRYFPVRDGAGKLMPNFIAISNLDSADPDKVREGNERVVTPRLSDAGFFWAQDRKATLDSRRAALADVVFEKSLGSLADKSARVGALAAQLAAALGTDSETVSRAAALAKTDLLTEMVGEFPQLQGRIGRYYAELDGENAAVAEAIEEHYLPVQAGGRLPSGEAGRILAIADRLDTLAGIFAAGKRPSGNKDPFGLRRAALGVVRILIEERLDIDITDFLGRALAAQPIRRAGQAVPDAEQVESLYAFLMDRARAWFLDGQAPGLAAGAVTAEVFESVRGRCPASPLDLHQRLVAVCEFMQLEAADSLAAANKRIANILRSAEAPADDEIDAALFDSAQERALFDAINAVSAPHETDLASRDYAQALTRLAGLAEPVDAFFAAVLVMAEDERLRRNRLAMLGCIRRLFLDIADISCIPTR